ncbi:glucosaminidase domain-containing protein [Ascidiaceihabitans sp.]|nr:glucosaminidase domain-containing protein [Ascidiaceihabitans sp.]
MSLMKPAPKPDDLMTNMRRALGPASSTPRSLEQKLQSLTETELNLVLNTAQMVKLIAQMDAGKARSYRQIVQGSYPNMRSTLQALIAEVLQDADPLPDVPTITPQQPSATEQAGQFYDNWNRSLKPTADDKSASALEAALADTFSDQSEEQTDTPPAPNTRSFIELPSSSFEGKTDFLARMTPVAKEVAGDLGISHKIVLAQAALESGWGKSVKSNNYFGIKSHGKAGGKDVITHEVINGKRVKITDSFRQYDTPEDSIRGYGQFLKDNQRYKQFLKAGASGNENTQLSALQSSGYATDPKYGQKLAAIMKGIPDEDDE